MRYVQLFLLPVVAFAMMGCASSQDKAYEAQEGVHNERLRLVEQYQKCMKDAGDDTMKADGCEQYLKASEALK